MFTFLFYFLCSLVSKPSAPPKMDGEGLLERVNRPWDPISSSSSSPFHHYLAAQKAFKMHLERILDGFSLLSPPPPSSSKVPIIFLWLLFYFIFNLRFFNAFVPLTMGGEGPAPVQDPCRLCQARPVRFFSSMASRPTSRSSTMPSTGSRSPALAYSSLNRARRQPVRSAHTLVRAAIRPPWASGF